MSTNTFLLGYTNHKNNLWAGYMYSNSARPFQEHEKIRQYVFLLQRIVALHRNGSTTAARQEDWLNNYQSL